jgi:hypothetical protein
MNVSSTYKLTDEIWGLKARVKPCVGYRDKSSEPLSFTWLKLDEYALEAQAKQSEILPSHSAHQSPSDSACGVWY